jgi:putative ABC transport system permease protein
MNDGKGAGLISENLKMAVEVLRAHKLRSGLIILSVAIGIASLMGMAALLLGLRDSIVQSISDSQQTVLRVTKYEFLTGGGDEASLNRKDITAQDAEALREHCRFLRHVVFIASHSPVTLTYRSEKSRMVQIMGSQPAVLYIQGLDLSEGRIFSDEELNQRAKVVVLGFGSRRDLFPNVDPIGKRVRIENSEFTVVGTFAKPETLFGEGANFALLPHTTCAATFGQDMASGSILATVREGISVEVARDEIIRVMRGRRKLKANQDNNFAVITAEEGLAFISEITSPIAWVLGAIASVSLLVGGIGVVNMMLVSVTERTGEIGIRKAVGARRRDIRRQFLTEAGLLTGIGGIIGIVMGLLTDLVVSLLTGLPFSFSPVFIMLAVVFSVGLGMFFGFYPAHRAAKLNPVNAIGYAK